MEKTKRITMAELARIANFDVSTVSRALNDSKLIKDQTKEYIRSVAVENGYSINASAQNLRRRCSQSIGIAIPINPDSAQTISDPFFLEIIGSVSQAASKRGYDLIVTVPSDEQEIAERRLLETGRADGLIVIGQAGRVERLNSLESVSSNIVVWGGKFADLKYTLVGSDNFEGGRLATSYLLSKGRKRILFVGDTSLPEVSLRFAGFEKAHREKGLGHDPELIVRVAFGGDHVFEALRGLLSEGVAFDAIFAVSDVLAISAIHAVTAFGLCVPDDIAIVGYDNIGQSKIISPSLTTIDQNIALGGEIMVELLLEKIAGRKVQSRMTPTKLIERRSA